MSKCTCIVKKGTLWAILLTFVLAVGLVLGIVFGMNTDPTLNNASTLTVTVDKPTYNKKAETILADCETVFDSLNVEALYEVKGKTNGVDMEIIYVFAEGTDLEAAKQALDIKFKAETAEDGALAGSTVLVMWAQEDVKSVIAKDYTLRGAIACAVIAVLACAYVCIRYRWDMGVLVGGATLLGMFLTTALVTICRIPVTTSVAYVVAVAGILTAVMLMLTLNNIRANKDIESSEEALTACIAMKEVCTLGVIGAGVFVILGVAGAIANVSLLWFALLCIVGLISAMAIAVVVAPSLYLPLKKVADAKAAQKNSRYQGAKKNEEE